MELVGRATPEISIILPVRDEGRFLRRVLTEISAQDYPKDRYEVILVDGESQDETLDIAAQFNTVFSKLRLFENNGRLSSRARNLGVRASRGKYIVFIDGHCHLPSKSLLTDMIRLFESSGADVLCRPQPLTLEPQTLFQRAVAMARASVLGHALDSTIYDSNEQSTKAASSGAMYRREVFDKLGYFDESFDACEDVEFNTRADEAGLRAYISPKLTVEYAARQNLISLFKQLYRYGVGRWQLFQKHPGTFGSGTLFTTAFTLCTLIYPILWLTSQTAAVAASACILVYLASVLMASLRLNRDRPRGAIVLLLPLIFLTIHFALGYGFLVGVVRHRS